MEIFEVVMKVTLGTLRVGALLVAMPVLSAASVPPVVRYFIAISFAVLLLPFYSQLPVHFYDHNSVFIVTAIREVFLGLVMGFFIRFISLLVSLSLEISSLQMGFSMANIFDPVNNEQLSVISAFGVAMMILIFFGANMHHDVLRVMVKSYEVIPIGMPDWKFGPIIAKMGFFMKSAFSIGVRLSFPILSAMLISNIIMGIISRTAPQMNLFFNAAVIINVVTGILLVVLVLPQMVSEMKNFSSIVIIKNGLGLW